MHDHPAIFCPDPMGPDRSHGGRFGLKLGCDGCRFFGSPVHHMFGDAVRGSHMAVADLLVDPDTDASVVKQMGARPATF